MACKPCGCSEKNIQRFRYINIIRDSHAPVVESLQFPPLLQQEAFLRCSISETPFLGALFPDSADASPAARRCRDFILITKCVPVSIIICSCFAIANEEFERLFPVPRSSFRTKANDFPLPGGVTGPPISGIFNISSIKHRTYTVSDE